MVFQCFTLHMHHGRCQSLESCPSSKLPNSSYPVDFKYGSIYITSIVSWLKAGQVITTSWASGHRALTLLQLRWLLVAKMETSAGRVAILSDSQWTPLETPPSQFFWILIVHDFAWYCFNWWTRVQCLKPQRQKMAVNIISDTSCPAIKMQPNVACASSPWSIYLPAFAKLPLLNLKEHFTILHTLRRTYSRF